MTFPSVAASTSSQEAVGVTTHTVSLPTSPAGEALILLIDYGSLNSVFGTPTGFTLLKDVRTDGFGSTRIFGKISGGAEGSSVTFATNSAVRSTHIALSVSNWAGTLLTDIEFSTVGAALSAGTIDPPALTTTWGSVDTTFFSVLSQVRNRVLASYPANCPDNRIYERNASGNNAAATIGVSSLEVLGDTSDPSAWTISGTTNLYAITMAIRPSAATTLSLDSPDTVTHGVATTATGNLLSTVTGMTLEYGTVALSQSFTLDGDDLDFTPDVGVPTAYGTGNAVDSLPLTPDHTSTGYTPYQVTLEITDG
jgi:hypothetical protein